MMATPKHIVAAIMGTADLPKWHTSQSRFWSWRLRDWLPSLIFGSHGVMEFPDLWGRPSLEASFPPACRKHWMDHSYASKIWSLKGLAHWEFLLKQCYIAILVTITIAGLYLWEDISSTLDISWTTESLKLDVTIMLKIDPKTLMVATGKKQDQVPIHRNFSKQGNLNHGSVHGSGFVDVS